MGNKAGMTSYFTPEGLQVPVTVIALLPGNIVTQARRHRTLALKPVRPPRHAPRLTRARRWHAGEDGGHGRLPRGAGGLQQDVRGEDEQAGAGPPGQVRRAAAAHAGLCSTAARARARLSVRHEAGQQLCELVVLRGEAARRGERGCDCSGGGGVRAVRRATGLRPTAWTRTSTWLGPGLGTGTSSRKRCARVWGRVPRVRDARRVPRGSARAKGSLVAIRSGWRSCDARVTFA